MLAVQRVTITISFQQNLALESVTCSACNHTEQKDTWIFSESNYQRYAQIRNKSSLWAKSMTLFSLYGHCAL